MEKQCPLLRAPCLEHQCRWYIKLLMNDPQKPGKVIDEFGCAVEWLPVLLIENSNQTRQAGASIDGLRNEAGRGAGALIAHLLVGGKQMPPQLEEKSDEASGSSR